MMPQLLEVAPDAVILMVTNPVDVVTSVALEARRTAGEPGVRLRHRARFLAAATAASHNAAVSPSQNVHAYIAGEHGDSEFALWSNANIGAVAIHDWVGFGGATLSATERNDLHGEVAARP